MAINNSFSNLSTVKFQAKLKPHALNIYKNLFGDCKLIDLRENGVKVHILDKEFGIDSLLTFKSGQWISIQEKYRHYYYWLKYHEFTQEFKNAAGTKYESNGEWFKLGAQLYFYGWANKDNTGFIDWVIIDILKYKLLVESVGGLSEIGTLYQNREHGKATFYAIPLENIKEAIIFQVTKYKKY